MSISSELSIGSGPVPQLSPTAVGWTFDFSRTSSSLAAVSPVFDSALRSSAKLTTNGMSCPSCSMAFSAHSRSCRPESDSKRMKSAPSAIRTDICSSSIEATLFMSAATAGGSSPTGPTDAATRSSFPAISLASLTDARFISATLSPRPNLLSLLKFAPYEFVVRTSAPASL
ncbi:hypothetical protein SDC9_174291 [bioreactor metagenome]|uniref:Uncharacterized protein n=1 Tax=bioreactor metagenome TaxID=1076179 RepID=A0A645GJH4_9ZZZZ